MITGSFGHVKFEMCVGHQNRNYLSVKLKEWTEVRKFKRNQRSRWKNQKKNVMKAKETMFQERENDDQE